MRASRSNIALLGFCLVAAMPVHADRRRAAAAPMSPLSIEFVAVPDQDGSLITAGSDAWIDLRMVSQREPSPHAAVRVRRRFGMRIARTGGPSWGTAVVKARLDAPDGRSSVRIDGQLVTSAPVVIASRATVGALTVHTLDIEVSNAVSAGPIAASISWEITTQ